MTDAAFSPFAIACGDKAALYRRTLRETSKAKEEECFCLASGYAAEIEAVWLERLIGDWMGVDDRLKNNIPCPHRVDALYVDANEWYLIEFKCNEKNPLNRMKTCLMYKAYDSVLQIVEHGLRTVSQIRENDTYIVVAQTVRGRTDEEVRQLVKESGAANCDLFDEAINGVSIDVLQRPWKTEVPPVDAKLDHWNRVLYKMALTLTPQQFNLFAEEKRWK